MNGLEPYFARIPALSGPSGELSVSRLAGLTNLNFLVELDGERYVVRVPGEGTAEYIDRSAERICALNAAAAGVNAEVLFFDPTDGLMMTRFVDGARTMSPRDFQDLRAVGRAGEALRRLHERSQPFGVDFKLYSMIDDYRALLESKQAPLPDGYDDLQAMAVQTRQELEAHPVALVPSHCDPLCENFLDTGTRTYIIDYEYAGNNDPMWDLGDLSVEGGFDAVQDAALLAAYFAGPPPAFQVGRMVAYKALCDLLWTLWGVLQHANGNPAEDFWAYAIGRFRRCRALMLDPAYATHLHAITTASS